VFGREVKADPVALIAEKSFARGHRSEVAPRSGTVFGGG
jgi:hypothetical protein